MDILGINTEIISCQSRISIIDAKINKISKQKAELTAAADTVDKNAYRLAETRDDLIRITNAACNTGCNLRALKSFKEHMLRTIGGSSYENAENALYSDRREMRRQIESLSQQLSDLRRQKAAEEERLASLKKAQLLEG